MNKPRRGRDSPGDTSDDDNSTRRRILLATAEVMGRRGQSSLSLTEVAQQAQVSRPTLYRYFTSKTDLLDAFTVFERTVFESGMSVATSNLRGTEKLDAALQFIVSYQQNHPGTRVLDIEPRVAIARIAQNIPAMQQGLERLISGGDAAIKASIAVRVALSHFVVRANDTDQLLAQLRHAVGIKL